VSKLSTAVAWLLGLREISYLNRLGAGAFETAPRVFLFERAKSGSSHAEGKEYSTWFFSWRM
jgi:hypothetical protein